MHHTPWTKKGSSLPSDRIRPAKPQPALANPKGKGKQQTSAEPPKSKEVRRIESLIQGLKDSKETDKDPTGGCFCQTREHKLSIHTPICQSCGLVLCELNLPQYCCPFCSKSLLTLAARGDILEQLESQLATTIAKEIEDRERAIDEAKRAAGAFPTLSGSSPRSGSPAPSPPTLRSSTQTHKVMSLGKSKKVTVSSYTTTTIPSRPLSRHEIEDEPVRVPPPSSEVSHAKRRPDSSRPWENLLHPGAHYIPPPPEDENHSKAPPSRRKRKNKSKGKENESATGDGIREGESGSESRV
ncbi:hypothetical protein BDQ12DRAFT_603886 [Crucibulum laeve]|uniref:TRIP4/RQT4 C2HC5-type zinc finger domain-containing protein n=1 Tax=Crucibulum laeve TaxID=68775 RepID=A0A5C3M5I8_9AGAR|nr:hypothetical protein BDQ12DRAFT_603886 [Crucibulum laeve]